jgi:signal transduction histidine kinase
MILLISSLKEANACTRVLEDACGEPVQLCSDLPEAVVRLATQEFSAVVLDQLLLDAEPEEAEAVLKNLGSAVPVYVNFAIAGIARVVRELRSALQRRKREVLAARRDAEQALRHELNDTVTALLLSCEMALRVPDLPELAENKMHDVEALAREVSAKLRNA